LSVRSSLRVTFRPRGVLVTTVKACTATFPSIRRGTSTCPRLDRWRRSRPHRSESAWRSTMTRRRWSARARAEGDGWTRGGTGLKRASTIPGTTARARTATARTAAAKSTTRTTRRLDAQGDGPPVAGRVDERHEAAVGEEAGGEVLHPARVRPAVVLAFQDAPGPENVVGDEEAARPEMGVGEVHHWRVALLVDVEIDDVPDAAGRLQGGGGLLPGVGGAGPHAGPGQERLGGGGRLPRKLR